ncbi:MAG TPA: hypothetical protein VJW17_07195, partial [Pyrinomonadaceae bacterium]|nr:hypothetical protein [Pyrinomonadaceae bacterium]
MSCNCGCGGTLPCGCCEGVEILTPAILGNRPGLDAIEYRVGSHGTFLETMKARLAGSEFSSLAALKTRNSDDSSIALLDAWATVGDVLTFYQERIANEGYLRTATERRSVLELARLVGYALRPGVAASAYLAYTLDKALAIPPLIDKPQLAPAPPDPLVTIPASSRAQSIPGPGELPQSFETSADLTARSAWNDLQVRLNRPQKIDADTRVIYLKGLPTLKPGDPLLIIASPPNLYRVKTVTPDAANNRTKVTYRPWLEVEAAKPSPGAFVDAVAGIIKRYGTPERFGVVRTSKSGREVLAQLERLRKLETEDTVDELRTAVRQEVLPKLKDLHQAAIAGRFTRVEPWVSAIVEELEAALLGRTERPKPPGNNNGSPKTTTDLTAVLRSLAKPPSIAPKDSQDLARSVGATLGSNTDIAPQVLTSLKPELKPILYKAWENVPVTAAPEFEVHSFKVRASVFGHNAPLEPVRNTAGVITGSKEWDLQLPAPTSTETFDLVVRQASQGIFQARVIVGQFLTEFADLRGAVTQIDFRAAADKIEVQFSSTTDGTSTFEFHFSRRPIHVRVVVPLQGSASATNLKADAPVTIEQPAGNIHSSDPTVTTRGHLTITGTAATREEPGVIWLDAPYDQILPNSWVALEKPSSVIDTVSFLPLDSTLVIAHATDVSERSRAEYGISIKSTRLRLDTNWIDPTRGGDSFETIRATTVFAANEQLELAEEPIEEAISGNELELDGLYDGLESGRWLIVTGERTDIVAASKARSPERALAAQEDDTEIQVAGVPATELVMLAAVEQRFDPNLEGDKTHTYLRLSNSLAYSYKRDTVIVYGNVVNSTHGETRNEVLGSGNAARELQEFTLKQSPLTFTAAPNPDGVESTLHVRINDVLWHEADSLAELGSHDYRYVT